jgi:glycerol-3-phosphate dehydrogenase (NAD(P)+)
MAEIPDSPGVAPPGGPTRAAVVGAGSWGTAFARHLASRGVVTTLLCRRREQAAYLTRHRRNPDYLEDIELPSTVQYGTYGDCSFDSYDLIVLAVPSRAYGDVARKLAPRLREEMGFLSLTKGLDPADGRRLSQILQTELAALRPSVAVLSGPSHAEEVARGQPTATVLASEDPAYAERLQRTVTGEAFRVYVNSDLVGVELAGAVKNVVALATGMSDGLGYGDNARAALITRGLAEMIRLGAALGADPLTFAGLAGLGDLVGTCTSRHSRNRLAGELIARGHSPALVEGEMGMVAEGLTAAPVVLALARAHGLEMPITENVVAVISSGKDVRDCVRDLMLRQPRPERV